MSDANPAPSGQDDLWLVCLCAAWCSTCGGYKATLAELGARHPGLSLAWIDIEDDSDALGDGALDIETFPTVMLLQRGRARFYGTVLPHAGAVERLLQALQQNALAAGGPVPEGLAEAVAELAPQRRIR